MVTNKAPGVVRFVLLLRFFMSGFRRRQPDDFFFRLCRGTRPPLYNYERYSDSFKIFLISLKSTTWQLRWGFFLIYCWW